jgi:nucleotidyltransferase/DNA polymerase involved in DNA repair
MLLARLATRKAKPAGQFQVPTDHMPFLANIPIDSFPGVGNTFDK